MSEYSEGFAVPKPTKRIKEKRQGLRSRAQKDPVSPLLRDMVLQRDGVCFLARLNPEHVCNGRLTVDHVPDESAMGRRAPSTADHLVAICLAANIEGPSHEVREAQRVYLRSLYGG